MAAKTRLEFCALNDYKCKSHYSCALCEDLWNAATEAAEDRFKSHNNATDAIPQCPSCLESRKVDLFWTCDRCGERWSADDAHVA